MGVKGMGVKGMGVKGMGVKGMGVWGKGVVQSSVKGVFREDTCPGPIFAPGCKERKSGTEVKAHARTVGAGRRGLPMPVCRPVNLSCLVQAGFSLCFPS